MNNIQKNKCIHDAEGTGIEIGDFFNIFNGRTCGKVMIEVRDEATGKVFSAPAEVVTQVGKGKETSYLITGFIHDIEKSNHPYYMVIQSFHPTGWKDEEFHQCDSTGWPIDKDNLQESVRAYRENTSTPVRVVFRRERN